MGKIRLSNNQELEIIKDGIQESGDHLMIGLTSSDILQMDQIFSDAKNTEKIWVLDWQGELFKEYTGFTQLQEVAKEYDAVISQEAGKEPVIGAAVRVRLYRPNDIEKRVSDLEKKIDQGDIGVDQEQYKASMVVARYSAQALPDADALRAKVLYPKWQELVNLGYIAAKEGYKFTHEDVLYKTIKVNQEFQAQWIPGDGTESIYTRIDETHAGTIEDPIPWHTNMRPELNKYYIEGSLLAKCIEDPGQALHNGLSELCPGRYFEKVG
ncbi:MAG: hypothetical protein KH828_07955 [Clostridiales bacterium]|nr:hypothetical protein [Clostridiales bacterium]